MRQKEDTTIDTMFVLRVPYGVLRPGGGVKNVELAPMLQPSSGWVSLSPPPPHEKSPWVQSFAPLQQRLSEFSSPTLTPCFFASFYLIRTNEIISQRWLDQSQAGVYRGKRHILPILGLFGPIRVPYPKGLNC